MLYDTALRSFIYLFVDIEMEMAMELKEELQVILKSEGFVPVSDLLFYYKPDSLHCDKQIVVHKIGFAPSLKYKGCYLGSYGIKCGGLEGAFEKEANRVFAEFVPHPQVKKANWPKHGSIFSAQFVRFDQRRLYMADSYIDYDALSGFRLFLGKEILPRVRSVSNVRDQYQLAVEGKDAVMHWTDSNPMLRAALILLIAQFLHIDFQQAKDDLGIYHKPLMSCGHHMGMIDDSSPDQYLEFAWKNLNVTAVRD